MNVTHVRGVWQPVDCEHRCSNAFCHKPGVVYHRSKTWAYDRHYMRRFLCAKHMSEYGIELRHGRAYYKLSEPRSITIQHEVTVWQRSRA